MQNKSLFSLLIVIVTFCITMALAYPVYGFSNISSTEIIAAIAFVAGLTALTMRIGHDKARQEMGP